MATFYSGWVAGDDWRIRADVDTSSPGMSTTGTVTIHVACENRYMTYSAGCSVTITCAGQTRTVTTAGVHGAGTYWAGAQTFTVGRGHGATGVSCSVAMSAPNSATGAYRAGISTGFSVSLDGVTHNVITFDGHGGTVNGSPSLTADKWYGEHFYIPTYDLARDGYGFTGWSRDADGSPALWPGSEITEDATITVYACWRKSYISPTVAAPTVARSDSAGTAMDDGTYAKISCVWSVDTTVTSGNAAKSVTVATRRRGESAWGDEVALTAGGTTSGTATGVVGTFDTGYAYDVRVTVTDAGGSSVAYGTVTPTFMTMDLKRGGTGVAFGAMATQDGFDVSMPLYSYGQAALPVLYYESKPAEPALPVKPCLVVVKGGAVYLAE